MKTVILKKGIRAHRRARAGRLAFAAATLVVGAFVVAPASARLPLDLEVPPLPPLPLPTLAPVGGPASGSVNSVIGTVNKVPEQLGAIIEPKPVLPAPKPVVHPKAELIVDSWSIERLPALSGASTGAVPPTTISSTKLGRPGSYTSLVGDGMRRAAGRAAHLAAPLAAPLLVALFALVMLALAARGPGRLVKVEEDRQAFGVRRSHRL